MWFVTRAPEEDDSPHERLKSFRSCLMYAALPSTTASRLSALVVRSVTAAPSVALLSPGRRLLRLCTSVGKRSSDFTESFCDLDVDDDPDLVSALWSDLDLRKTPVCVMILLNSRMVLSRPRCRLATRCLKQAMGK